MSDPCICDNPPSVSNGQVTYTGSYINGTRAEYDCDEGYTNNGGSSLICRIYHSGCSNNNWITDPDDPTSGTPDCQYVASDIDNYNNTYRNSYGDDDTEFWILIGLAITALVILLILILLLLWWFCCRECCRRCCVSCCPCCRECCYEIPYARGLYGQQVQSQPAVMYDDHPKQQVRFVQVHPEPASHTAVHQGHTQRVVETKHVEISPETYRKRYGYYPRGYASPSAVDLNSDAMSQNSGGAHPKEYVNLQDEKMELPQGKPVDTKGQPVWMPHTHQVRQNLKTSTK